jgi:hypothetical protein
VKNFLCATDNHLTPVLPNEIAKQLFKNDNSPISALFIFLFFLGFSGLSRTILAQRRVLPVSVNARQGSCRFNILCVKDWHSRKMEGNLFCQKMVKDLLPDTSGQTV